MLIFVVFGIAEKHTLFLDFQQIYYKTYRLVHPDKKGAWKHPGNWLNADNSTSFWNF